MYKTLHHSLPYKKISWGSLLRGLLFVNFFREEELWWFWRNVSLEKGFWHTKTKCCHLWGVLWVSSLRFLLLCLFQVLFLYIHWFLRWRIFELCILNNLMHDFGFMLFIFGFSSSLSHFIHFDCLIKCSIS